MRISGTEPSSVIIGQTKQFKQLKSVAPKVPKTNQSKTGCCNKSTKRQLQSNLTRKILMLSKCYQLIVVDRKTRLHVPWGTVWSTSSDTRQVIEI